MKSTNSVHILTLELCLAILLVSNYSPVLLAQIPKNSNETAGIDQSLVFSRTASINSGTNLWLHMESPVFNDKGSSGKPTGSVRIGFLEMLELEVSNEGIIARPNGDVKPQMMWGMKCRIYESGTQRTNFSALLRTSLADELQSMRLRQRDSSILSDCAYRFVSVGFVGSHTLNQYIAIHCGAEFRQLFTSNETLVPFTGEMMKGTKYDRFWNGYAFMGANIQAWSRCAAVAELQSLPELAPSSSGTEVDSYYAFRGAIGFRYAVKHSVVLLVHASRIFLPTGSDYSEIRLGVQVSTAVQ